MKEEQMKPIVEKIVEAFDGIEIADAIDIYGTALSIISKHGQETHDLNKMQYAMLPMYHVARLVSECHGRDGIIHIKDDGSISFTIQAGKNKKLEV